MAAQIHTSDEDSPFGRPFSSNEQGQPVPAASAASRSGLGSLFGSRKAFQ